MQREKNIDSRQLTKIEAGQMEHKINPEKNKFEQSTKEEFKEKVYDDFAIQIKNKRITLHNGKVNQEYKQSFNIEQLGIEDVSDFWFEGLENIGLHYNKDTAEIRGEPTHAGEYKITLYIKRKDWTEGKPIFERTISLSINPDPKSLWKNILTDTSIEYFKPDCKKELVKEGIKTIAAASQRGRSHAHEGNPREDDFGLAYDKAYEWYILTVADGAGSAKFSRKGSEIACQTVIEECRKEIASQDNELELLIKNFYNDKTDKNRKQLGDIIYKILGTAVFRTKNNIEKEAKEKGYAVKDYAATVLISLCKKYNFGWFAAAFWVGDGGIGIYNKETQFLKILGEPDGGEYAGQTRFLTMPEIIQPAELYRRLRFEIVEDFTALVLMTDGISDPKFESDANLFKVEKWNELWSDLCKEVKFKDKSEPIDEQLLKWLDFWAPGNHDDRTIAILF